MRKSGVLIAASSILIALSLVPQSARAEMGIGLRGGTFGLGVDFDLSLVEKLNLRLGYNYFDYSKTIDDTDVSYDGDIKIGAFSALLDWHVAGGGFRFSGGLIASGPKVEVVGTPSSGNTYQIGNGTYTASQVGSLRGEIKIGASVAPYVGLGWGNVVSAEHRVSFLFDLGIIYGGDPDVTLTATCGAGIPTGTCNSLQADVQREIQEMKDDVSTVKIYPVINLGIGIRF